MRSLSVVALSFAVLLPLAAANAEISVAVGPTTIPRGDATGARDITVSNDFFAIAFAVDTAPPWGMARGGILDIAPVTDGEVAFDIASLADFMPNRWSSWSTSYQHVSIERASADEAVIKVVRDWGNVELETLFHIRDGDSKIHIVTQMTNSSEALLTNLYTGYIAWPDGGSLIGAPDITSVIFSVEDDGLANWSASYDEDWVLGLHAPFSDHVSFGGRDRYLKHDLLPGETKRFEAWLQIENNGSLASMVQTEIDLGQLESGRIFGHVAGDERQAVAQPVVVVSRGGTPYAWTVGNEGEYAFVLPKGEYEISATAKGYGQSPEKTVVVKKGSETKIDFNDVKPPGTLHIKVADSETEQALDARISIKSGYEPIVGYFGKSTFFTELQRVGETTEIIAPGNYVLQVSAGGGFTSTPQLIEVDVQPGELHELQAVIATVATPQEHGWYNADLHHHSDVLDGFTEAEFVLRSELAAGVDIAFLSDHDSIVNNSEMRALSDTRDRLFIPGTEMSPSWAHFNAYPLDDDKTIDIPISQATVQEIFAAARDMGADIIEVNHPYSPYGYFESHEKNVVPGDYDSDFDLVEIEPNRGETYRARNLRTLKRVWQMWNEGKRAYLAAGSDVHDVWLHESGSARTFVHVDGKLSIEKFIDGLKAGHSFASQGPLVYPEILFGSEIIHPMGDELALSYSVQAVSGLRSATLIERGNEIQTLTFDGEVNPMPAEFSIRPESDTWYSLTVEDMNGKFAYTNPVWVMVSD